ncbi:CsgG/HfaB family protein [Sphingobacterium sp. xlx-130]|uniref:CsgG/HfaB family protein n=1 Tax=Sphingobacterium sp. xlx-130 TaxID=2654323 RepID=UPI0013DB9EF1|nr:CsgG/HfaB family protein [Sphingobacterium sp. xlx-130]
MFKQSLCFLSLMWAGIQLQAQEKINVAFIPITYDETSVSPAHSKIIQEGIVNSFVSTKRFTVVDRSNLEALEKEKKLQRTEAFMDSKETFKDGVSKGASYLVEGNILSVKNYGKKDKWKSDVNLQLKVIDVSTGEIVNTESINSTLEEDDKNTQRSPSTLKARKILAKKLSETQETTDAALAQAIAGLHENVKDFVGSNFPLRLQFVEWLDSKGNKLTADKGAYKFFLVTGGSDIGIQEEQLLDLVTFSSVSVGDKTIARQQKIGTAIITKVDGANFSTARLLSGEKEIKNAVQKGENFAVVCK